jgi:hypothetical protein
MSKFEKKITELGLEEGKLSKNLNKMVKDFRKAEAQLEEMKEELEKVSGDEKEQLKGEIAELEEALAETDEELVGRVQTYADNREYYAQKVQDLNRGRQKAEQARGAASNPQPQPQPQKVEEAPKQVETPKIEEAKVVSTEPAGTAAAKAVPIEEKKESSNWLLWGVLGIAGIMVGVNLFRNKN